MHYGSFAHGQFKAESKVKNDPKINHNDGSQYIFAKMGKSV
jgi:hypothetical protein